LRKRLLECQTGILFETSLALHICPTRDVEAFKLVVVVVIDIVAEHLFTHLDKSKVYIPVTVI